MALYINGNKASGGIDIVHLTQAQYDALPSSKNYDGKVYMITDTNGDGQNFQPVIYSEDEREIGVWTDGKPLYEIAYERTTAIPSGSTVITDLITDCETIVNLEVYLHAVNNDTEIWTVLPIDDNNGVAYTVGDDININISSNYANIRANAGCIIKVQYTKTTDQAGSGTWTPQGVPAVHYSTDEKVVGTWIDGSTLYEKTFDSPAIGNNSYDDIEIQDVDNVINVFGISGEGTPIPYLDTSGNSGFVGWYKISTGIMITTGSSRSISAGKVVIQYTKTQGGN